MKGNLEHFDANLCKKLFDFIYPDEGEMTRSEVQTELQRLNIDMKPIMEKLDMALNFYHQKQKAQAELRLAREKRPSLIDKIKQIKLPSYQYLRDEIQNRIAQHLSDPLQATYFHKLEEAASEQDLKTLLDDILVLESLSKDSKNEKQ